MSHFFLNDINFCIQHQCQLIQILKPSWTVGLHQAIRVKLVLELIERELLFTDGAMERLVAKLHKLRSVRY